MELIIEALFTIVKGRKGILGGLDSREYACNIGDQVRSLDSEDFLEKRMATHSSILVWIIPWAN